MERTKLSEETTGTIYQKRNRLCINGSKSPKIHGHCQGNRIEEIEYPRKREIE